MREIRRIVQCIRSILIGWTMGGIGRRTASPELEGRRRSPVTPPAHKGFGSRVLERVWSMNWKARCIWTTGRMDLSARWRFPYQKVLAMDKLLSGRGSSLLRMKCCF